MFAPFAIPELGADGSPVSIPAAIPATCVPW